MAPSLGILSKMVDSGLLSSHLGGQMRFVHFVFGGFLAGSGDVDLRITGEAARPAVVERPQS